MPAIFKRQVRAGKVQSFNAFIRRYGMPTMLRAVKEFEGMPARPAFPSQEEELAYICGIARKMHEGMWDVKGAIAPCLEEQASSLVVPLPSWLQEMIQDAENIIRTVEGPKRGKEG